MRGECEATERCLFCAFCHIARLHPRRLALLQPQTTPHILKEARADRKDENGDRRQDEEEEGGGEFSVYKKQACNPSSIQEGDSFSNRSSFIHRSPSSQVCENSDTILPSMYHGDMSLTYSELLAHANTLAFRLQRALSHTSGSASSDARDDTVGLNSVEKVGILIGASIDYVVAVLAVLQCGFAFVPLEPSWPAKRITEVVTDSKPCMLLTSQQHSEANAPVVSNLSSLLKLCVDVLSLDVYDHAKDTSEASCVCFCHTKRVRSYSYLLYTSGSSGKPKGVYGTELGLMHRLLWMQSEYPFCDGDVAVFKSSIAFIDHLTELFGPLLGGSLVIVPPAGDLLRNPLGLLPFMQAYNVSRLTAVPSLMRTFLPILLAHPIKHALMSVKVLVLSGEILPYDMLKSVQALLPHATILNLYGSTELSGDCLCFNCGSLEDSWVYSSVPIGKPLPGCFIELFFENSETGSEGELLVGGVLVSLGYHDDATSTSSKFTRNLGPDGAYCDMRFFRTGDYVKKLRDGNLLFLGRKDRIVKVNGHKVALDEIERNMERHPLVAQSAVNFEKGAGSDSIVVAYIVLKHKECRDLNDFLEISQGFTDTGSDATHEMASSLRSWLVERLPSGMIPSRFTLVSALPMVSSGKVDHHALSMLSVKRVDTALVDPPNAEVSSLAFHIKQAFQRVLKAGNISVHDDFFSLGGTSVSAAHLAHILAIDMQLLYLHGSVVKLEAYLRASQVEAVGSSALKLDEGLPGWRALKRVKRDDCLNAYQLASCSCFNTQSFNQSSNSRQSNLDENYTWPCVPDSPMALLRCNVSVSLKLQRCVSTNRRVHNLFLDSESTKRFCNLSILWKTHLNACVDASPVLVQSTKHSWHVFIGSHAHNFACLDAYNGNVVWERDLGGRVESTAAITSDLKQVVVGCYDGYVYFLESETGAVVWKFQTKAEVKCQPTVNARDGLIWCGSHDHHLYLFSATDKKCVWEHDCEATIFAAAAHDSTRCLTYVATTAGTVTAFFTGGASPEVTWTHVCGAPVFGSLVLDPASGYVVCVLVNGGVLAFMPSGSIAWKYTTRGPVFAGATLTSALPSQVLICSRDDWVYSLHLFEGNCLWKYCLGEPITSAAYVDEGLNLELRESHDDTAHFHSFRLVCVCGSSGQVHILRVHAGSTTSSCSIESSCSHLVEDQHKQRQSSNEVRSTRNVVVATKENQKNDSFPGQDNADKGGEVFGVQEKIFAGDNGYELLAVLKLPGDVFSSPVMLGGRIFVGCRDNNLYCLEVSGLDF